MPIGGGPLWSRGETGRGAIIVVNCDNDDGKAEDEATKNVDTADKKINGAALIFDCACRMRDQGILDLAEIERQLRWELS